MTAIFNVFDYGAKGDGVSDDTLAIQKAINAAAKAGGGEVISPTAPTSSVVPTVTAAA